MNILSDSWKFLRELSSSKNAGKTHWMPKEARFESRRFESPFDGGEPKKGSGSLLAFDGRRPAICSPIDGRRPPAADALLPRRSVPTYVCRFFLRFEILSEVEMLTTFYLTKNDHRWVTFISLKTTTRRHPFVRVSQTL